MLVAFAGQKGVGKTTAVDYLLQKGYKNINFADPVKRSLVALLDLADEQVFGNLKEVVDSRYNMTPRQLMQKYSDFSKECFGEDIFVRLLVQNLEKANEKKYVIGDLRYPNEAEEVKKYGIIIIVERETTKNEFSSHSSETSIDLIVRDEKVFTVANDGTPEELFHKIDEIIL
jgi:hypothetical protein